MKKLTFAAKVLPAFLILATATPSTAQIDSHEPSLEAAHQSEVATKAKALMKDENYKKAIEIILNAQESGEKTFAINQLLVDAYGGRINQVGLLKKRGLAVKMRKAMEYSLELKPDDIDARKNLLGFHLRAPGAVGGSKDKARELIEGFPDLTEARRLVYEAQIAQAEKDLGTAVTYLDKALVVDPDNSNAFIMKGNIQIEEKSYEDALSTFDTCTRLSPETMPCYYLIGKVAHVGNIEIAKGLSALETFLDSDYEDKALRAHAYYRRGEIQARSGDTQSAKKSFEEAITLNDLKKAKMALSKLRD